MAPGYGCTADDKRIAASTGRLRILDAQPHGATPYGNRSARCEPDDRTAYAGQSYRFAASRADLPAFHQDAAVMDGWGFAESINALEGKVCASKAVGDDYVHLSVRLLESSGEHGRG
ncbi:hypothetical protein [Planobispora takensis]|uniref:Uncharacterized protein n=1 Tax=Planobispora takensis TaxID=1367882 RepID=A0A8J3T2M0_9ACTN|nr:hypothetical protein [Planobispora takensis]GII02925.1 hypothetical protein Pta02_49330 [Planobispora takensis]